MARKLCKHANGVLASVAPSHVNGSCVKNDYTITRICNHTAALTRTALVSQKRRTVCPLKQAITCRAHITTTVITTAVAVLVLLVMALGVSFSFVVWSRTAFRVVFP